MAGWFGLDAAPLGVPVPRDLALRLHVFRMV